MQRQIWHILTGSEICKGFEVSPDKGLSDREVNNRLARFGHNVLTVKKGVNPVFLFMGQFKDFMVLVLMIATLVSGLLGEITDAITILAIILVNAVLGFVQEYRAERSMESLRSLTAPEAVVLRNESETKIPAADLVPGDIVIIEAGDRIPADVRWLKTTNLRIEESALTGESHAVAKNSSPLMDEYIGIADRKNMGYMGTVAVNGRGLGVIVGTGMDTEMGMIAGMIQDVKEEDTPLQKRLAQLGKWLVTISVAVCIVVVITGILQGESFYKMFFAGVSLAVAAIPEGLPAIVTVALAIGVQRMVKSNAIIRKLPAVETLGCATVICSDKTGTLTQNEMTVRRIYCDDQIITISGQGYDPKGEFHGIDALKDKGPFKSLLKSACLCNNSILTKKGVKVAGLFRGRVKDSTWGIQGDPTEGALLVAAAKAGVWRENFERKEDRLLEIPFDSDRKRMTVVYKSREGRKAYVKGAPDVILSLCTKELTKDGVIDLAPERKRQIMKINDDMASQALRVLAIAERPVEVHEDPDTIEENLVFIGLMGMIDPPRKSAEKAIKVCQAAGIKPVMITGDHKLTAQAVARELGILKSRDHVVTGVELDRMTDEELAAHVMDISVFARVAPRDKLRIVRAYKNNGQIVAMTGDGVRDNRGDRYHD